jgi:hypothetical protein
LNELDFFLRTLEERVDPTSLLERVVGAPADPWQKALLTTRAPFVMCLASRRIGKSQTTGVQHTRMQIVGGDNENETKERATTFWNVGKNMLLGNMNSALHTGDLRIGEFPGRDDLRHELESFEMTMTDAGRVRIEGGTRAGHADIAMAAAMSFALSDHRSVGAFIGETRLRGYW